MKNLSRRDFFKKSAEKALPIMAGVVFMSVGIPSIHAATGCDHSCVNSCSGDCAGGCTGGCRFKCTGCSGGCSSSCHGSCTGSSAVCTF